MFKFKGISSDDMQVVVEEEEEFIARAAHKYEQIDIDGRDGAEFNELGYSVVERPICVQCLNINKIDEILVWLDGEGEFEYKGRKTIARFYSELEPKRSSCIRIIDATFIRDPFWNKANEEYIIVQDDKIIVNEGNIRSRPKIKLKKTLYEDIDLTINDVRFKYHFKQDSYVEIDCEQKKVKYEGLDRNRQIEIGYDFPMLNVGTNNIVINSGDCEIEILRKDMWL